MNKNFSFFKNYFAREKYQIKPELLKKVAKSQDIDSIFDTMILKLDLERGYSI